MSEVSFFRCRRLIVVVGLSFFAAGCEPNQVITELPPPYLNGKPPASEANRSPLELPHHAQVPTMPGVEPGWLPPGGISQRWSCIVIHHSANDRDTPHGMADWHVQRGWDELGYHFVIGNGVRTGDGQIFVGSRWPKQKTGAHCKVPGNFYNEHGIGICLIGNLNNHPPTPRQIESLNKLVTFLMKRGHIPSERVYTHGGVTHKTECPGRYFSLSSFRQRLQHATFAATSE